MNKTKASKYLDALNKIDLKCVTSDTLASQTGIYPDIIAKELSFFQPIVALDTTYNLKELVPLIEKYIKKLEAAKPKKRKRKVATTKKEKLPYESIADFVYQRMTFDGLLNRSQILGDEDLKMLRKLITQERTLITKKRHKK